MDVRGYFAPLALAMQRNTEAPVPLCAKSSGGAAAGPSCSHALTGILAPEGISRLEDFGVVDSSARLVAHGRAGSRGVAARLSPQCPADTVVPESLGGWDVADAVDLCRSCRRARAMCEWMRWIQ